MVPERQSSACDSQQACGFEIAACDAFGAKGFGVLGFRDLGSTVGFSRLATARTARKCEPKTTRIAKAQTLIMQIMHILRLDPHAP